MNSKTLIKMGFQNFGDFDLSKFKINGKDLLSNTGVYVFTLKEKFGRLIGKTDILYIGQSGGAKKGKGRFIYERIKDYCSGYESAPQDKRMHDSLKELLKIGKNINILFKIFERSKCRKEETNLLKLFYNDHLELPPWNRQP